MTKRAKKKSAKGKKKVAKADLLSHPGTTAMFARAGGCNKPPIKWIRQDDGSWLECYLMPNCRYGGCHEVPASQVPSEVRNG